MLKANVLPPGRPGKASNTDVSLASSRLAPPVYRPAAGPASLNTAPAVYNPFTNSASQARSAPRVYAPYTNTAAQSKFEPRSGAAVLRMRADVAPASAYVPVSVMQAPPVYNPFRPRIVQPPSTPPAYAVQNSTAANRKSAPKTYRPASFSVQAQMEPRRPVIPEHRRLIQRTPVDLKKVAERVQDESDKAVILDLESIKTALTTGGWQKGLEYLSAKVQQNQQQFGAKKALTRELEWCETKYGFDAAPTYWKVLTPEVFSKVAEHGALFKDVGAGFQHGEYTHRIQWYLALYVLTNAFTTGLGLTNTPPDLLKKLNTMKNPLKKSDWPSGEESGFGGLWDAVFDRNNQSGSGNPKKGYSASDDGATSPEALNARLLNLDLMKEHGVEAQTLANLRVNSLEQPGDLAKSYQALSAVLTRRYIKRHRELGLYTSKDPSSSETNLSGYRYHKLDAGRHQEAYESNSGVLTKK
ncbi:MAG: LirA/MavJ family T4SS effector [Bryobacteraceae bacterium]